MSRPLHKFEAARGGKRRVRLALIPALVLSTASRTETADVVHRPRDFEPPAPEVDSQYVSPPAQVASQNCAARRVTRDELLRAMAQHGDYDILATTNRGRFSSELLLRLGREAMERDPDGGPLYIEPEDWFYSYLETAGVSEDEAPTPSRLGFENRQRVMIEYRPDRVLARVEEGPEPVLSLSIRAWWDVDENPASNFSFTDTTSTPQLKVTSRRDITYRLLEFADMIVVDKIEGVSGRPVSGVLGALFSLIGEGGVKQSRLALSDDGAQVTRTRSKKVFSITVTAYVEADGTARKGLPSDRPDLETVETRLRDPLKIDYVPYEWAPVCSAEEVDTQLPTSVL